MNDGGWRFCKTLGKGGDAEEFEWRKESNCDIYHRSAGESGPGAKIDHQKYSDAVAFVASSANGTKRADLEDEIGVSSQPVSRIAAILVQEGVCDFEHHGKTISLYMSETGEMGYWLDSREPEQEDSLDQYIEQHMQDIVEDKSRVTGKLIKLQQNIQKAQAVLCDPIRIDPKSISQDWESYMTALETLESSIGPSHFVYIFDVRIDLVDDYYKKLERTKKEKTTGHKYSRVNTQDQKNGALYVGSSQNRISPRIKQHLGQGYPGTYALHLSQWVSQLEGPIWLRIIRFDSECTDTSALQAIEDSLWADLRPAFGRQGAR